jgi:hypothetical protein
MQVRPFAIAIVLSSALGSGFTAAQAQTATEKTPVVVELFTSEGCSSCPPADLLLGKIDTLQPVPDAQVIVLGEHVDYWEDGGWHDRFSSHAYTDRQKEYDDHFHAKNGIYTPQMVVDGSTQFLGSDPSEAVKAITAAAKIPKPKMTISNVTVDGRKVSGSLTAAPFTGKGDLYAVLVDPTDSTDVKGGENKGHHVDHAGVVRTMQHIGTLKDLEKGPRAFSISAPSGATPATMRLVVFAQRGDGGPIVGAVSMPVTATP